MIVSIVGDHHKFLQGYVAAKKEQQATHQNQRPE